MGVQEREKKGREVAVLNSLDAGELRGYYGTTRDISQWKRLREKTGRKGAGNPIPLSICSPRLKSWCKHNVRIELLVGSLYIFYFSGFLLLQGFPTPQKLTILNSNSIWKVSPIRWGQFQRFHRLISSHT